jgi:hypothetical protein
VPENPGLTPLPCHTHPPWPPACWDISSSHPYQDLSGLDLYFAMARGTPKAPALDMSKYFDTNYHYLVPELSRDFKPTPSFSLLLDKLARGQEVLGKDAAIPMIIGRETWGGGVGGGGGGWLCVPQVAQGTGTDAGCTASACPGRSALVPGLWAWRLGAGCVGGQGLPCLLSTMCAASCLQPTLQRLLGACWHLSRPMHRPEG